MPRRQPGWSAAQARNGSAVNKEVTRELRNPEQIWLDTIVEDQAAGPTSRLHDYAVGVVYDALQVGGDVRIQTEAGKSDNLLRDDVAGVSMDETVEVGKPESTEGRPWGQPLKKAEGAPLNLG